MTYRKGHHPNQLRALSRSGNVNPYGRAGNREPDLDPRANVDHLSTRPNAMKRKRVMIKDQRKRAIEMHELQKLARENAVEAMEALIDILKDPRSPHPSRIAAASVVLDRGYGKASQTTISANIGNGTTKELTGDELERRIGAALKRVEAITTGASKAGTSKAGSGHLRKLN
jgi:hypothetical protein